MEFTDQLSRKIDVSFPPQRIISLVPSQTELLFDLGLSNRVAGVTKFCIHPAGTVKSKTIIGGTKNFRFDVIDQLKPDLIIGNKEENYIEGISILEQKYPVWMSDISDYESALAMIRGVAAVTGTTERGKKIISTINRAFERLPEFPRKRVLYLIWHPWMAAGTGTFIHSMLSRLGLINVVEGSRYPELSEAAIRQLNPDVVLLSSEPFPFKAHHENSIRQLLPHAKVVHVDGELFSWYGSRMAKAPAYFASLLPVI
ncbi:MAG: ABC transporter substrate-binding protein [Cyclobacteriaceae bacterium]|nr:ABC transporter substrate-binding protein [Cyclobacteriaceae bacterium]